MFEDLDELARGLAENDVSRRQAIKWAGYSVLGAALSSMGFAESAEALTRRQRRRCRRKGGIPLEEGNCHCGFNCDAPDSDRFTCQDDPNCICHQTTEGRGFCATNLLRCPVETCSRSRDCPPGWRCVVNTCCDVNPICVPPCGTEIEGARVSGITPVGPRGA